MSENKLEGLHCGYFDDLLRTGTKDFKDLSKKTHEKFDMDEKESSPVTFSGFSLSSNKDGSIDQDKLVYLKTLD